ncbi:Leo1-like protein-domain-containing protein [Phellopilus nigrolimitatus]|nr:Leo1-like protein-domain-containing protein [Phellopilus nigrolimitatus]
MTSLADAFLDPQLEAHANGMMPGADPFVEDVKPELKVEIPGQEEEMEDLFGDEDADLAKKERFSSPTASAQRDGSEALSAAELKHRKELEYEEDDGQDENVVELKHAVLSIPNIPMPKSSDGNNWVIKMPNFVKLDPKPYHPETYVGPDQASDNFEEKEKSMSVKLEVENTIRWRWAKDEFGQDKRQSNSRVIRWSDGSLSLLLGKELFDISQAYEGAAAVVPQSSSLGSLSQSQTQSQNATSQGSARGSGLTYLVAQHKRPGILQAEAPITGHMSLRPTGMQSETHRKLARAVGQKHSRVARLRIAPDSIMELEQQELVKAAQKKPRRARASGAGDDFGSSSRKRRGGYTRRRESVWSDEEPEAGAFGDSDEEDEGEYDASPRKTRRSSGDGKKDEDGKRGAGEYQTDDFLVADSSEAEDNDNSDRGGKRRSKNKKRKRRSAEVDANGEVDALDELDAKIARQDEESRHRKRTAGREDREGASESAEKDTEDVAMDMDVESEEEEEEFNVRRTGTGSRKKRAIAMDDEEDE